MSPFHANALSDALCEVLRGRGDPACAVGSAEFAAQGLPAGVIDQEAFRAALRHLQRRFPGQALDFEKLLADDPIENDPLIAQGNLALLRLDDIYREVYGAWKESLRREVTSLKHTVTPPSAANYADRVDKIERAHTSYFPDPSLIEKAITVTLAAFRIQVTLTHRRETLKHRKSPVVAPDPAPPSAATPAARPARDEQPKRPAPTLLADRPFTSMTPMSGLSSPHQALTPPSPIEPPPLIEPRSPRQPIAKRAPPRDPPETDSVATPTPKIQTAAAAPPDQAAPRACEIPCTGPSNLRPRTVPATHASSQGQAAYAQHPHPPPRPAESSLT